MLSYAGKIVRTLQFVPTLGSLPPETSEHQYLVVLLCTWPVPYG